MNRSAMGFVVTLAGSGLLPFVAKCIVEDRPGGVRVLVDDGSGGRWFPREGLAVATETDDSMDLAYSAGQLGETGITLEPATVERWNELVKRRPEMDPVRDIDDLAMKLRW